MIPALERRLRQHRSRLAVRAWDYRQRGHARGMWFRLRRVLADAREAHVIGRDEALALVAEGHPALSVGGEMEPPKLILFVPADRIARLGTARKVPVRLDAQLLGAECLALTAFDERP